MISVWTDYNNRVKEIDLYFEFLNDYSNDSDDLFKILKANGFLLIYNLIESTVRNGLEEIHSSFNNDVLSYSEVIDEIKSIWIDYNFKKFKNFSAKNIALEINEIGQAIINVGYSDYIDQVKSGDISGNLDRRKIELLADRYKFKKNTKINGTDLFKVKNNRNRLAHGEISFKDLGKAYDKNELNRIKRVCELYLKEMLLKIDKYIQEQGYKK
ncbi:MAE_28990/MAE_18760 family HEPN-like nuclease [Confluentibacter sediminis]|uniref:MAE_28990/MAE_18760 family HEPN-like nuclease n=1 Tax=Confluentibacter sediminis TaxID=2219045 RepID=UPI000DAE2B32|nr:MAE_28990/MAE_18760 family HEPN-like nuclease [Confluentibacter sediminis]